MTKGDYAADLHHLLATLEEGYAYGEEKRIDWSGLRARLSPRAEDVVGRDAFIALLEDALDALHDAHASLGTNTDHSFRLVPTGTDVWAEIVDGRAFITEVRSKSAALAAGLHPGDEIVAIQGAPLALAISRRLSSIDTAALDARTWALQSLLAGRHDEPRVLRIASPSGTRDVTIAGVEGDGAADVIESRRLPNGFGYINVHNHLGDDSLVPAFDSALDSLLDCPAILLDLRDTPSGGNTGVAEAVMGRFVHEARTYQRYELPKGGWNGRSRVWDQYVMPRGARAYDGRLAVLVDHWTGSMGEGMAIGFDGMKRAIVVGTRMAGLHGAVYSETLPKSGIGFTFPAERLFHVGGVPRHEWRPPILVDLKEAPVGSGDPVLDAAVHALEESIRPTSR